MALNASALELAVVQVTALMPELSVQVIDPCRISRREIDAVEFVPGLLIHVGRGTRDIAVSANRFLDRVSGDPLGLKSVCSVNEP
jgi:hypothetical protein